MNNQITRIMSIPFCVLMIASNACAMESVPTDQQVFDRLMAQQSVLTLNNCNLDDNAVCVLATKISGSACTNIDLGSNKFGTIGFKVLVDVLAATKVTNLSVGYNKIDDDGIQHLCVHISLIPHLKYLDLRGNPLGDKSRIILAKLLDTKSSMTINVSWETSSDILKNVLRVGPVAPSTDSPKPVVNNHAMTACINPVNIADKTGKAPIHYLMIDSRYNEGDYTAVLNLLLTQKADVNLKDSVNSFTPLHYAVNDAPRPYKIPPLLSGRADTSAVDTYGCTPLLLAMKNGHIEAVKLLLQPSVEPKNEPDKK